MMKIHWRYWIYGVLALGALAAYFPLDEENDSVGGGVAGGDQAQIALPPLNALHAGGQSEVRRDLFVLPAQPVPVATVTEEKKQPPPPPPVDRLGKIEVFGFVRQRGHRAILLKTGNEIITITIGQRFGTDEALEIDTVEAGEVRISDHIANISKTFTLSEE